MRTLSVIGVEDGAILAADENGERFRIPVDESVRNRLAVSSLPPGKRPSPKEIQAQVRAGASVEEVAETTGTPVAYVERFVRPVLAERAFVLESAKRVVVQPDAEAEQPSTFGAVLAERLASLNAADVSWTSLKEAGGGWIVCVEFRADDVDHDARWTFDPKRRVLEPENIEASTLSQQGTPAALTPRLRVLEPTGPVALAPAAVAAEPVTDAGAPDRSRFDSAIFELPDLEAGAPQQGPVEASVLLDALARKRVERETLTADARPAAHAAPIRDADAPTQVEVPEASEARGTVTRGRFPERAADAETHPEAKVRREVESSAAAETQVLERLEPAVGGEADEAFRRPRERGPRLEQQRRPESQQHVQGTAQQPSRPQTPPTRTRQPQPTQGRPAQARHVDMEPQPTRPVSVAPPTQQRARRGRTSLPSWDEIVFGKGDD